MHKHTGVLSWWKIDLPNQGSVLSFEKISITLSALSTNTVNSLFALVQWIHGELYAPVIEKTHMHGNELRDIYPF
jgi:hypothetical protein